MELKQVFIHNLRKFRISKEISQMKLAEICDTSPNYIAAIEIGRRFPSLKLIEKIGAALQIEPYRFFIDETNKNQTEMDEIISLISKLPDHKRLNIINRISMH
ncbi:MAG: helix-turn-helix transcriptional regulator [Treponema sp.]|nr:helix-turn-helix transcriptional regulator [Treponema sp.]